MTHDRLESRAAAFRLLAQKALHLAEKEKTQTACETHLRIATEWLRLADDVRNLDALLIPDPDHRCLLIEVGHA